MASLTMPTLSTNLAYSFSSSISSFSSPSKPTFPIRRTGVKVPCNATNGDHNPSDDNGTKNGEISQMKLDRRNMLLGIGGLYGATTLGANPSAYAAPLSPTFTECYNSSIDDGATLIDCCPPAATASEITEFVPTVPSVVSTRLAAHMVDHTLLDKYKKALTKMKNLNPSDPRSFAAQAKVHCAYCDGGYYQEGQDSKLLDVHFSWLFFPFHRWYLYFFEKICQNLIDDDTFAIPFWNWDTPEGMYFPTIFNDPSSPLYDTHRNSNHIPSKVLDLNYHGADASASNATVIKGNLFTMYKQMTTHSPCPHAFFGKPFRAGDEKDPGQGPIESTHNNVHLWIGDPNEPHGEDMGNFYSAGWDPVFYCHHANVDRLWNIWNTLGGQNITDSDWLNSSFYFYNENAKPVKVYVKDCLDTTVLGYNYQSMCIPWLYFKPTPRHKGFVLPSAPSPREVFPTTLERTISVAVKRPKKSRKKIEKQKSEEILEISGIEYNNGEFVKFDVYVNEDKPDESGPEKTEYLGSFASLAHGHSITSTTTKTFALTEVLEELGADNYDTILVTLVPKCSTVTIKGLKIKFEACA